MVDLEAQRLLDQVILNYLFVRGLHHTREIFYREIFAGQNVDAANSSQEAFLQMWWGVFYETYNSVFFDFPIVDAEFPDEENAVVNNVDANQSNASDVIPATLSPHLVESSPVMESSDSQNSDSEISELLAKDSSMLQSLNQLNDMDVIRPFARNTGYGTNLEGPTLMHAPTNALPTSPEFLDAAVNSFQDSSILRSLDQLNETEVILPFARNAGYDTNMEELTLMEPNMHAPKNALPTSPEFLDAAVNSFQDSSILRSLDQLNETEVILPFARNAGYGTNLKGPTLMEPNMHAPRNALPTSPEFLDAAVNSFQDSSILRSLDQLNEMDVILPFARNAGYDTNMEELTLMEPNMHAPTNALPTSPEFLDAAVNSFQDSSILRSLDQLNETEVILPFARNAGYDTNMEELTLMEPNMHAPRNALPTSPEFLDAAVNSFQDSSILRSLDQLNETEVILPFARNAGYGTNLKGPTLMEPNMHAPRNALPTSPEFLDAGNNRSLQQASQQEWSPNVLPDELDEYYANKLKLTLTNYKNSLKNRTQGESSEKNARVFTGIHQRTTGKLLADQPMVAPTGRNMRSYEKQPVVQSGEKRKTSLNSLAFVEKGKGIVITDIAKDNSIYASTQRAKEKGNNRSLQASHQEWPSNVLPDKTDEYYADKLKLTLANYKNSPKNRTQGESSEKNARVFTDTNQRASGKLLADQPMVAPTGRIKTSYEKQPVVQTGKKRKTLLNSLAIVEKEKGIVIDTAKDNTRIEAQSNSIYALMQRANEKGISIKESHNPHATNIKFLCCHFDTQGEFLATAGHDRKVLIWELGNGNLNSIEGHTHDITDVRFKPNSTVFATSSFDKTVKIWDAAQPNKTFRNLAGHDGQVMSVDYHPTKVDLLSSCDHNNEIRLWDVNMRDCKLILKGGSRQVRFQSQLGKLLASSTENIINIFDIETTNIQTKLQGHVKNVRSICWDITGNYLASVSEDRARIWSVNEGICIFELLSGENKFQSCIFHPVHYLALVIGSNKFLEFWNPILQGNMTSSYSAHDGIITSLADSPAKSIIASVSDDQWIKIWS